jgi:DNA-binding CsgD family transcriptional regulator
MRAKAYGGIDKIVEVRIPLCWGLTRAESRIVRGLLSGFNTTEMAKQYGVSVHTIRTQVKRAMRKAGVHTQAGLVALAYSYAPCD